MATPDIWRTCVALAALMRNSPDVDTLRRVFDCDSRHGDDRAVYEEAIEHYLAGMGMLRTRPLLFALHAPQLPPVDMPVKGFDDLLKIDGFSEFFHCAQRAAGALLSLVEYLRSRLPGYPDFPVPQLRAQSPRVDMDGLLDQGTMPWPLAARALGLENHGAPPAGLRGVDEPAWARTAEGLLEHLGHTEQWSAFASAATALLDDDREQLREACGRFDERTRLDEIHRHAGGLLVRQVEYRRAALAAAVAPMTGGARSYVDGFDGIDLLIDQAATVISDLAVFADLVPVPADVAVSWQRHGTRLTVRARFAEGASPFLHPGRVLAYAGEPLITGAWICHGTTFNFHRDLRADINLDAVVLPGSETLVRRETDGDRRGSGEVR